MHTNDDQPQIVGFVVTPDEIADRVKRLEAHVRALDALIEKSKVPAVNAPYRQEWSAFMRRWALARDSFASWGSRLFATRVIPILEQFEASYLWWARDFQKRTGQAVKGAPPAPVTGLIQETASMVPTWAWLVGGLGLLFLVRQKMG